MIIQLEPNTLINVDHITFVKKISDNKLSVSFTGGDTIYVNMSVQSFLAEVNPEVKAQYLSETCA